MTALPEWMIEGLTAADYEALPEDVCRQIEVVDGAVVVSPSPRRSHQLVVHELVSTLKPACGPHFKVVSDVDLRLRDIPLLNRRPDIVVYDASLPDDVVLRPENCLMVVEVMSPGSITTDQVDKPAEYAVAGIKHFWRVEFDDDRKPTMFRYRFDPTTRMYAAADVGSGKLTVSDPFDVLIDLDGLV